MGLMPRGRHRKQSSLASNIMIFNIILIVIISVILIYIIVVAERRSTSMTMVEVVVHVLIV